MSDCGCKTNKKNDILDSVVDKKSNQTVSGYIFKIIAFLLMILILPIINLFIIWFIFRTLVLNKEVDIKPLLVAIGSKFNNKEDNDTDFDSLTEDDVEMINVEDLTLAKNNK